MKKILNKKSLLILFSLLILISVSIFIAIKPKKSQKLIKEKNDQSAIEDEEETFTGTESSSSSNNIQDNKEKTNIENNTTNSNKNLKSNSNSSDNKNVKPKIGNYSLKLIMVGDALIHDTVYEDAKKDNNTYDFKPMLELIKPIVKRYDLAYYNQETIIGGKELGYSTAPRFNSPKEVGDAFVDAGFNMVSLANNHTLDKGEKGIINSVNYWKSQKNVIYSGQQLSNDEYNNPKIYNKNGISFAFLSYTTINNNINPTKNYLINIYSESKVKKDIATIKDKVDFIIVAMHWGDEYIGLPSNSQKEIAKYLSSLGVDLIIGSHPHVIEPIEYIGKTLVIYSLGNFLSDQKGIEKQTGLMIELTLKKVVDNNYKTTTSIINPKYELTYTHSNNTGKRDFKIYLYSKLDETFINNYNYYYDHFKKIVSSKVNIQLGL